MAAFPLIGRRLRTMRFRSLALLLAGLCSGSIAAAAAQTAALPENPAADTFSKRPWEWGPFFQGGNGFGMRSDFHFTSAGVRLGKVLTDEHLGHLFRGQFEFAGEIMPYWQAFTPPPHQQPEVVYDPAAGLNYTYYIPIGGGTYTGVSLTPVILRWDFKPRHSRFVPWFQAAGGLIYTTHKFPPDVLVPHGLPGGTSVWNFSPQGGLGLHYFLRSGRAITFSGNGVHISSASLGDRNPGVNGSIMFQIGYTFFSRK